MASFCLSQRAKDRTLVAGIFTVLREINCTYVFPDYLPVSTEYFAISEIRYNLKYVRNKEQDVEMAWHVLMV